MSPLIRLFSMISSDSENIMNERFGHDLRRNCVYMSCILTVLLAVSVLYVVNNNKERVLEAIGLPTKKEIELRNEFAEFIYEWSVASAQVEEPPEFVSQRDCPDVSALPRNCTRAGGGAP